MLVRHTGRRALPSRPAPLSPQLLGQSVSPLGDMRYSSDFLARLLLGLVPLTPPHTPHTRPVPSLGSGGVLGTRLRCGQDWLSPGILLGLRCDSMTAFFQCPCRLNWGSAPLVPPPSGWGSPLPAPPSCNLTSVLLSSLWAACPAASREKLTGGKLL